MYILQSIAPIFLLIALGKWIKTRHQLPEEFFKGLNSLTFRYMMPALLIDKIAHAQFTSSAFSRTFLVLAAGTAVALLIGIILAYALGLTRPQAGSFIQGTFRGNTAFIGLPLIAYAVGDTNPEAVSLATIVFGPGVVMFNLLSVLVLLHHSAEKDNSKSALRDAVLGLVKNPLILGCLAGFLIQAFHWELPFFLDRTFRAFGQGALPLALLSIGAGISFDRLQGTAYPALFASLIKIAVTPMAGFLLAPLFGLTETERIVAVLLLACPTAVNSYVMAEVLHNDGPIAGRIIILTTIGSMITLPLILLIAR